jgi:ABC-type multidrug transport system ATPase subunit
MSYDANVVLSAAFASHPDQAESLTTAAGPDRLVAARAHVAVESVAPTSGEAAPGPRAAPPLVSLHDLDAAVGRTPVLRGVDLELRSGDVVALRGPNGSGKSTLLRVLATLLRPVGGDGHVLGARLGTAAVAGVRRAIGLVGHEPALHPGLSLRANLLLVARLVGRPDHDVERALDRVGLLGAADRDAAACSQGMRRRAELGRVLLTAPQLLLLDEAHAALDPAARGLVHDTVRTVTTRDGAAVVVSHDAGALAPVATRNVVLTAGRVEEVAA